MLRMTGPQGIAQYPTGHPFDKLRIPVLHSVGWFDNIAAVLDRGLRRRCAAARRWRGLQYLDRRLHRPRELPPARGARLAGERPRHQRRGAGADAARLPGAGPRLLRRLPQGGGRRRQRPAWRSGSSATTTGTRSPTWPPPGARELRLYLGAAERAASGPEGGALLAAPRRPEPAAGPLGARPRRPGAVVGRQPVRLPARVAGRARGRAARRRAHLHE